ncbi:MAG TPA: hypothetical protein VF796_23545 [Humisphaera sp.]
MMANRPTTSLHPTPSVASAGAGEQRLLREASVADLHWYVRNGTAAVRALALRLLAADGTGSSAPR